MVVFWRFFGDLQKTTNHFINFCISNISAKLLGECFLFSQKINPIRLYFDSIESYPGFSITILLPLVDRCDSLFQIFRGDVSYEFFYPSGDMSNLAYIGAKNLNFWPITGFVYYKQSGQIFKTLAPIYSKIYVGPLLT